MRCSRRIVPRKIQASIGPSLRPAADGASFGTSASRLLPTDLLPANHKHEI